MTDSLQSPKAAGNILATGKGQCTAYQAITPSAGKKIYTVYMYCICILRMHVPYMYAKNKNKKKKLEFLLCSSGRRLNLALRQVLYTVLGGNAVVAGGRRRCVFDLEPGGGRAPCRQES
jgi:hypothetical protein